MGALQPVHILILVVVLVVLFGAKRLPDASRSLGRSMRIFKSEITEMGQDGEDGQDGEASTAAQQPAQAPVVQQLPPAPVVAQPVQPASVTPPVPQAQLVTDQPVALQSQVSGPPQRCATAAANDLPG